MPSSAETFGNPRDSGHGNPEHEHVAGAQPLAKLHGDAHIRHNTHHHGVHGGLRQVTARRGEDHECEQRIRSAFVGCRQKALLSRAARAQQNGYAGEQGRSCATDILQECGAPRTGRLRPCSPNDPWANGDAQRRHRLKQLRKRRALVEALLGFLQAIRDQTQGRLACQVRCLGEIVGLLLLRAAEHPIDHRHASRRAADAAAHAEPVACPACRRCCAAHYSRRGRRRTSRGWCPGRCPARHG